MAFDAPTMLTLSLAIAAAVAAYLAAEWRAVGDRALLYWSGGFASITLGCSLSPLREGTSFFVGVWVANGLLVLAHLLFLLGVARFADRRPSRLWWAVFLPWALLLALPGGPMTTLAYGAVNALLVAALSLIAAGLLGRRGKESALATDQLRYVLLGHGLFYAAKALLVFAPGAFVDLASYRGLLIQASLLEGVVVEVLIALSMTGTVRRRREREIERLAERDPLTGLFNRRAFDARAPRVLERAGAGRTGALVVLDVDHFKLVNDHHGHGAGDRMLVLLSGLLRSVLPEHALIARLGGDEFAFLIDACAADDVARLCDELRIRFREAATREAATHKPVTLSIGAVLFARPSVDLAALFDRADVTLYDAKHGGRDRVRVTGDDHPGRTAERAAAPARPVAQAIAA